MSGKGSSGQEPKYFLTVCRAGQVDEGMNGERQAIKGLPPPSFSLVPPFLLSFFPSFLSLLCFASALSSLALALAASHLAFRLLHPSRHLTCNPLHFPPCLAVTDADAAPSAAARPPARATGTRGSTKACLVTSATPLLVRPESAGIAIVPPAPVPRKAPASPAFPWLERMAGSAATVIVHLEHAQRREAAPENAVRTAAAPRNRFCYDVWKCRATVP